MIWLFWRLQAMSFTCILCLFPPQNCILVPAYCQDYHNSIKSRQTPISDTTLASQVIQSECTSLMTAHFSHLVHPHQAETPCRGMLPRPVITITLVPAWECMTSAWLCGRVYGSLAKDKHTILPNWQTALPLCFGLTAEWYYERRGSETSTVVWEKEKKDLCFSSFSAVLCPASTLWRLMLWVQVFVMLVFS